jgi:hypothetical protein
MPVLFVGHGSPLNAIELNRWSAAFRALAGLLPRPRAVLAWYVGGIFTTGNQRPTTSRDFAGFPEAVHAVQYPAPGDLALARRSRERPGDQPHRFGEGRQGILRRPVVKTVLGEAPGLLSHRPLGGPFDAVASARSIDVQSNPHELGADARECVT